MDVRAHHRDVFPLEQRLVRHLLAHGDTHISAVVACLTSLERDRRLTARSRPNAASSPSTSYPSCPADLVLKLCALVARLLDLQHRKDCDPLSATGAVFDELLKIVDVQSEDSLNDLLTKQRRQAITRLCHLLELHFENLCQPHLAIAADGIRSLVESVKPDALSEYVFLRERLKPFTRESLQSAILDGPAQSAFDGLAHRFGASGEEIRSKYQAIERDFWRNVDADPAARRIPELLYPLIRDLPSEIYTPLREVAHDTWSASKINQELRNGQLLANLRTAVPLSTRWFIDCLSRLVAAINVDLPLSGEFSAAHAAIALLTSLSEPVQGEIRQLELPLHRDDRDGFARGLLALTVFQPLHGDDDMTLAAARQTLADQLDGWKATFRSFEAGALTQAQVFAEAQSTLRWRVGKSEVARRRRDSCAQANERRRKDLDAYLKERARDLAVGGWGPEFQEPAYRLCRALRVRLPFSTTLPSDAGRSSLVKVVRQTWRQRPAIFTPSSSQASAKLRRQVISHLRASRPLPDAAVTSLVEDLDRHERILKKAERLVSRADERGKVARTRYESAGTDLRQARDELKDHSSLYDGLGLL